MTPSKLKEQLMKRFEMEQSYECYSTENVYVEKLIDIILEQQAALSWARRCAASSPYGTKADAKVLHTCEEALSSTDAKLKAIGVVV